MPGAPILPAPPLLVTRPEMQGRAFGQAARRRGIDGPILFAPVMRMVSLGRDPLPRGLLVFTSANAVAAAGDLTGRRVWVVGAATGQAAVQAGADVRSADGDVQRLAALLIAEAPSEPITHLRGAHVAGDLAGRLRRAGIAADERIAYAQESVPLGCAALAALGSGPVLVPLFSPRSARLVAAGLGSAPPDARVVAISAAVASGWPWPDQVHIAARPDADAVLDCLAGLVAREGDR